MKFQPRMSWKISEILRMSWEDSGSEDLTTCLAIENACTNMDKIQLFIICYYCPRFLKLQTIFLAKTCVKIT